MEEEQEEQQQQERFSDRITTLTKEDWDEIHNPEKCNALTVTKLVEYMGLGYSPGWGVLKKKEHNDFVKSLLEYGRNMEELAVRVIPLFHDQYGFKSFDIPKKNEIWFSMIGDCPITERYRKGLMKHSEDKEAGRPLYGSPDMLALNKNDEIHVIEIKCPRDQVCLVDMKTQEDAFNMCKQKAYINSKDRRIVKKFMGHILQVCVYAWILNKNGGVKVSEECSLMYFYPDIATNKYFIIAYDIDWDAILDLEYGWDLELVLEEFYERFLPLSKKKDERLLQKFRRGVYPLLDDKLTLVDLFSKGILRTRMLVAGGESTKEITSYALDQYLPGQGERIPLEC